jgi:hypothetical protein
MNNRIKSLILGSDSRYLTAEEHEEVKSYLHAFEERMDVASLVEDAEDTAVRFCIDNTRKRYPNFDKYHDKAWAKAFRDVQLTTRFMTQAMLIDEISVLEEKLLFWLRTILAGLNFTPEFNRDTYTFLKEGFRQALPPDAFAHMDRYFDRTIDIMSSFPQPASPAV